tara:strand:+ start:1276 stop:1608 length:333 start_codon:yes stop_codon:yes gene_type:complete
MLDELIKDLDQYQSRAKETAIYPDENWMEYLSTGLAGEVGELCSKVAKSYRKDKDVNTEELMYELGDIMWFVAQFAGHLKYDLSIVASENIAKLQSRKERGVIRGDGDKR